MRLCIVIHHLFSLSGLPSLTDPRLKRKHRASGTRSLDEWRSALCSFSVLYVQNDAASSNPETHIRCFVGGRSQSMSSPCRLGSVPFNSICFFGPGLSCRQLLFFLPNLLSIYTLHLSYHISSNQAKLPFPQLESW